MRILSKFRDYYDTAMGYGIDKERVYARTQEVHYVDNVRTLLLIHNGCYITLYVIGFCGKLFGVAEHNGEYFYNFNDLEKQTLAKKYKDAYNTRSVFLRRFLDCNLMSALRECTWTENIPDYHTYFQKYNVPIFSIKVASTITSELTPLIVLNPKLSAFKFYQIKDAFTAYQEIDMYLHNELANPDNPHIDPVSDVIKAESHGFNKYSFRKDKTKHK